MYITACTCIACTLLLVHVHVDILSPLQRGETEAAMSDYATVVKLQPNNEEALIRQAKHRFNKR